jgi:hypothetical protein
MNIPVVEMVAAMNEGMALRSSASGGFTKSSMHRTNRPTVKK